MGIIFTLVSTGVILSVGKTILKCQKVESDRNKCQLTVNKLLDTEKRSFSKSIKKAEMDVSKNYDSDGPDYSYGIVLISETNTIPLSRSSSFSKQETLNKINKINEFINDPNRKSLTVVTRDSRLSIYAILGFFLFAGILLILGGLFANLKTTLLFKKSERELEIKRLKIIGYFTKKYSFSEIDRFLMETKTEPDKETNHTYQMKLKSGEIKSFYKSESRNKITSFVENSNSSIQS